MMLRIYVDNREKNSGIPEILKDMGISVIIEQLDVADYVLADGVAVERKSVSDLVNSVFDKRFFDQINRLTSAYETSFLLIEGNLNRIREITEKWKAINSALISIIVDYDVKVVYSSDKRDTAEVLVKLAEKFQEHGGKKRIINLHDKPKFESIKDIQLYVVESFPNIGEVNAKKLLEKFSTIRNICNASISDLEKVLGSRKRAEELYKILITPYSPQSSNSNNKKSLMDFI
ncbi:3'-flap repair endonuclease Xpf [Acidianus ambivalens]|uniref:Multidrug MFS transporter n=1 Tax=Acidianus ambivalens TaxID=2283 RepID=A0A650CXP1_ACIAM|nr:3'-flap repair endonuclease Xpf [Acidianus ambivalens]MQL54832.1 multidrug MFS transporter [Acidianus ambivalens]QGR22621.1 multidrug MFS transporter [Acidianus ambivalens]